MRELAYMDRLFKQQERLKKQRERIQGIKRDEPEEGIFADQEIILEEKEPERKITLTKFDKSAKWARRKAKWDLRRRKRF